MDVFDMRYMKRIRLTLRCIGGWPNHMFEDVPASKLSVISRYGYTCLLCTLCCFAIVAQITYLRKNMETLKFIDLGQTYLTILMSFVYLHRHEGENSSNAVFKAREQGSDDEAEGDDHALYDDKGGESLVDAVYQVPWECMDTGNRRTVLILLQIVQQTLSVKACGMVPVGVQTMLATYNRVNKLCEMATIIQHIQLFTSALMFNIGPIYSNYKSGMFSSDEPVNGTFEHSVSYALPFAQNNKAWYTVICLYNFYVSYNVGCMFCCHDLLICLIVFHIWGHLNIFEHNLNFFPRPNTDDARTVPLRYSYEENKQVAQRLQDIVKYYIIIKEFLANTSSAYSVTLCVYYGFHLVSDCVLLLECSTLDPGAVATYGLLTLVVYQQLIQLSTDPLVNAVYGLPWECMDNSNRRTVLILLQTVQQSLALKACNMGESLVDAVYQVPWECMDTGNRRTVLILLQIVQQTLSVKACGMVPVGVQTMLAILKGSFSYFLMLRTFAAN
ncbi:hypothetical protein MSG28_012863 [Choristoneura fumiferana]|uniref:Uncharacterized protein n=2 Tax=Choristoneura fumiferana TaxID=7141 RepID=A0ACC0JIC3_CHOFU|nr:hypothetical protein MSG28_012863 [Choristoneura fumiferana]KAI8423862.1 hypothetical protein MSG28_012863 [Choristoneura fumiferana]